MYSVFIIEDEIEVAQIIAQYLLSTKKYQVMGMANDLATARSLLNAVVPELVLLDVYLPDGNSLDLLSDLRNNNTACEVVLMTAAKEVQILEKAMHFGVFDFLVKPILLSRLEQTLCRFEHRQLALQNNTELTQSMVDDFILVAKASNTSSVRLPKGVDPLTLQKIRQVFTKQKKAKYTANCVGMLIGVSRSTARRYLEFLVENQELAADQSYGSIGRPERSYQLLK